MKKNYKICIVGGENTGKTTFVRRYSFEYFPQEYTPTMGVEVHPVQIKGDSEDFSFNCYDCAGKEEFRGLVDGYYLQSEGFIVFASTEAQTVEYLDELPSNIPCVLVLPKQDGGNIRPIWVESLAKKRDIPLVGISSKEKINIEEPFNILVQKIK